MWVLFEFDSLASKEKFLNHSGIGSWFTELIQATSSFENDESIVWISIEGLPIKAWSPNTFRKIASLWGEYVEWEDDDLKSLSCKHLFLKTNMKVIINESQKVIIQGKVYWIRVKELDAWFPNFQEDDQDDLSSDGESQKGDVANKADNKESDVDRVSESSFTHENDTAHKDVNSCKKEEVGSHSEDPFNIYDALSWYKHLANNNLLGTWAKFSRALELRFGPSTYENHQATLFKLKQTSTVPAYQTEFERISNCVTGLLPEALLNCFLSGLLADIQNAIAIHHPTSLHQAYGLAKLIEDKINLAKPRFPTTRTYTNPSSSTSTVSQRRAEDLCFRCPEKFHPGHKCNPPQFLLIFVNDDQPTTDDIFPMPTETEHTIPDQSNPNNPLFLSLSDTAAFGLQSPRAVRVTGYIHNQPVTILIDCGSTHNIIQPRIANLLPITPTAITPFPVMVGNGHFLECKSLFQATPLEINKTQFHVPLFVIPVQGADFILGLAWLSSLGPILADFSIPQLSFNVKGSPCVITGQPFAAPVTPSTLHSLIRKNHVASLHTMIYHHSPPPPTTPKPTSHPDPTIETLLTKFQTLFEPPHTLPLPRPHDHHIPFAPNTNPINIKPYRYPHYQKEIMTSLIKDMLTDGVIQPSQSPYSSPVLLVQKKDGTWRFCVDYRALNAATIRDRFPIPIVDELLDELHGSKIFSKIDLRAEYHQIRVAPEDIHKTAFRTIDGHYEFRVMPFGLTNAPSTFQAAMNDLFRSVLRKFILVFFDDILVYSESLSTHYEHLRFVFQTLLDNQYHAKASKCQFAATSIPFLGHNISADGVQADPDKLAAIKSWPSPNSFTTLRAFLGLTGNSMRPHWMDTLVSRPHFNAYYYLFTGQLLKPMSLTSSRSAQSANLQSTPPTSHMVYYNLYPPPPRHGDKQEVLIKWMNQEQEEATWEDLNEISTRFPDFIGHEDASVLQREEPDLDELGDELVYPDHGEALVIQRLINVIDSKLVDDNSRLHNNIFRTKYTFKRKIYDMIKNGGSCENVISTYMVEKFGMKIEDHLDPTVPYTAPKATTSATLATGNTRERVNNAPLCYKCSGLGHYARDCLNMKTLAFVPDDADPIYYTDAEPDLDELGVTDAGVSEVSVLPNEPHKSLMDSNEAIVVLPTMSHFEGVFGDANFSLGCSLLERIVSLFDTMLGHQGEGSSTPTEPHHTPFPEAETSHPTTSSIPLPSIPTALIPPVTQPDPTPIRQYTRRARISQSFALPTVADEPASPVRDAQEEEIVRLKEMVQVLKDREGNTAKQSGDDAPIKGRSINEGEAAAERISNDSDEIARVLTSMDAATVLAGGIDVPTGSGSIPTTGPPATIISTGSKVGPTAKEQQEKEDMRMNEQLARDAEVARIHAEEELQGMIDSLDKSNETIAKKRIDDSRDIKVDPPKFEGSSNPDEFLEWVQTVDRIIMVKGYDEKKELKLAVVKLKKYATLWFENVEQERRLEGKKRIKTWFKLKECMKKREAEEYTIARFIGGWNSTIAAKLEYSFVGTIVPSVVFLDYVVSKKGISMDPSKVEAIKSCPTPSSITEVKCSHWKYKFPLPVKVVATVRRLEMPLLEVCTVMEEKKKKLPVKDRWQLH
nr:Ty3/gypsy retrotransposon protein [Tanacetum cinerariifolium]